MERETVCGSLGLRANRHKCGGAGGVNMKRNEFEETVIDGLPVSAASVIERPDRYGDVPGLSEDELADPEELERVAFLDYWEPILTLPVKRRTSWMKPNIDESGRLDWGAFDTLDFERLCGTFDKARYKADRLREELEGVLITLSIVRRHVEPRAMALVLRHLEMGIIGMEHIVDEDMLAVARLYRRAERLKAEIREVRWTRG